MDWKKHDNILQQKLQSLQSDAALHKEEMWQRIASHADYGKADGSLVLMRRIFAVAAAIALIILCSLAYFVLPDAKLNKPQPATGKALPQAQLPDAQVAAHQQSGYQQPDAPNMAGRGAHINTFSKKSESPNPQQATAVPETHEQLATAYTTAAVVGADTLQTLAHNAADSEAIGLSPAVDAAQNTITKPAALPVVHINGITKPALRPAQGIASIHRAELGNNKLQKKDQNLLPNIPINSIKQ